MSGLFCFKAAPASRPLIRSMHCTRPDLKSYVTACFFTTIP